MNLTKTQHNWFLILGVPFLLIVSLILLTKSEVFHLNVSQLSIATTLDLVFTIPLVYFFLIRKSKIDKKTVVPFFILGIALATFVIPKAQQGLLSVIKTWIVPIVEIGVVTLIILNIRKAIKIYKTKKEQSFDIVSIIRITCTDIFPKKVASFLSLEILAFYYGFIHWKKIKLRDNEFTYHKNTGSQVLFVAIIFLIAIETVAFHVLLNKWSSIAAWILTGISIYSAFQIFGFLKSISKRPTIIDSDNLKLRYGIMSEVDIEIDDIKSIEMTTASFDKDDKAITYLSLLGDSEGHNIILTLKKPYTLNGVYGIRKEFQKIALFIDDKNKFQKVLENKIISKTL